MADFNKVKIGTLWLTDDGTETGASCLVNIPELSRLRPAKRRTVIPVIEGSPVTQLMSQLGEVLTMSIFLLHTDEWDDLIEIIDTADSGGSDVNIIIEGELGNFDLDCVLAENPAQSGEFASGRIPEVTIQWRISDVNTYEEPEP